MQGVVNKFESNYYRIESVIVMLCILKRAVTCCMVISFKSLNRTIIGLKAIHRKAVHHRENIAANAAVADADNISSVNVAVKIRSTCSLPVILYISC